MASVDITAALMTYLKTVGGITTLIGTGTAARIFPDDLKQGTLLPACTLARTSGGHIGHLKGRSGLNHATFQIVSYGSTRAAADQLDNAVFDAIGDSGSTNYTMGSVKVTDLVAVENSRDSGDDLPVDGSDARRYWARTSYRLFYFDA